MKATLRLRQRWTTTRRRRTTSGRWSSSAPSGAGRSAATATSSPAAAHHTGLPQFLINFHRVDDKRDMEAYIARLSLIDDALDQLLVRAKAAAADGIRPPRSRSTQALDEVKRVTTGAPFTRGPDTALFADAKAKIAALKDGGKITADEAAALTGGRVEGADRRR